jgi:hypothetical protein
MNTEVPYMPSVTNVARILDAIQKAGAPEAFGLDFLKDLGFTSSNDRAVIKLLKYIGFLDTSGKPQTAYREFMDGARARSVLATKLRSAYDDLFTSDREAHGQAVAKLKGWFKTKTGVGDAVAEKMASTFKALANYATFEQLPPGAPSPSIRSSSQDEDKVVDPIVSSKNGGNGNHAGAFSFAYRIEVHLPDTANVDTYRAIFKALREELG